MLFPDDYMCSVPDPESSPTKFITKRPPTTADYERFIHYSQYLWHLDYGKGSWCPIPEDFFEDYFTLFPTRSVFPQLKSLTWYMKGANQLPFLIHSGIKSLQLDRPSGEQEPQPEDITVTDLQAILPNLIHLRDLVPLNGRTSMSGPDPTPFQKGMDSILHKWTQLRRLEVSRYLPGFFTLFIAISELQSLQYLKIVVAQRGEPIQPSRDGLKPALDVVHTASKLDIEGELEDLHIALRICSTGTQLTHVGLLLYRPIDNMDRDNDPPLDHFDYFFLPPTLSQKKLTELTINGYGYSLNYGYPSPNWQLPCSVLSTLVTPKCNFTAIEIGIPYFFVITESFLDLIAKTSPALKIFIILTPNPYINRNPTITLVSLIRFALSLPNLLRLGLEVDARPNAEITGPEDHTEAHLKHSNDSRVLTSSFVKILEVGVSPIDDVGYVVECLRRHFTKLVHVIYDDCRNYCWCDFGYDNCDSDYEDFHLPECEIHLLPFIQEMEGLRRIEEMGHEPKSVWAVHPEPCKLGYSPLSCAGSRMISEQAELPVSAAEDI
ncbi:hypothetical protein M408DRAFT_26223 [Serendipita vermifera MAFF 305830]|uniref:Uncharacterized protein n=1 Tax=Serendipita vermifera MAFF 305830 TaxID=933852 RepID=A0A0C3AZN8_SERVB|nr:hypothetical protein M408DRAFT_26223 [Serendipita vermifera MAFF 305830]